MRVNLTKKDLINTIYMQIGFSKQISENLIDEFFYLIVESLKNEKKISERNVVLFKASREFKELINFSNNE